MTAAAERRVPPPWLKPGVLVGSLVPVTAIFVRAARGELGADPIAQALNQLGLVALVFLIAALSCSPLKLFVGWTWPIRLRRMLGVLAVVYAALHVATYVALDQSFDWAAIFADVVKRKFLFVGLAAFVLIVPLAATSTNGSVKRLGFVRWKRLHRMAYLAPAFAVLHFVWRVKKNVTEPAVYGTFLAALLLVRVYDFWWTRREMAR